MLERGFDTGRLSVEQINAWEPVGRMGTPEEIAESVLWLMSDAGSFVTGHPMSNRRRLRRALNVYRDERARRRSRAFRVSATRSLMTSSGPRPKAVLTRVSVHLARR
jgi:hypothetical protein